MKNTQLLSTEIHPKPLRPVKIVQFGEGNFLRAFADYFVQLANDNADYNGDIVVVKPTNRGGTDLFDAQQNLYNVVIRGLKEGRKIEEIRLVDSVVDVINPYADFENYLSLARCPDLECIISNTTEAGIAYDEKDNSEDAPASTFPGKLTQFLYERFRSFGGSHASGLHILPCELIDNNADVLKSCVLRYAKQWQLPDAFSQWMESSCVFHNTLVDRIVSGFPRSESAGYFERLGYEDRLLTVAEPFALWVIEADENAISRAWANGRNAADLPILIVKSVKPYKERKVRILNGAHTAFAMLAWLCGFDYVREAMADPHIKNYVTRLLGQEVVPYLSLPAEELNEFCRQVIERFQNPFMNHALLSIALNSVSKWKARCLPSLLAYCRHNKTCPPCLTFSLAALLKFYRTASRASDGQTPELHDTDAVLGFFSEYSESSNFVLASAYLSKTEFHGMDLNIIPTLTERVVHFLDLMDCYGVSEAFCIFLGGLSDESISENK